ncbi:hypothetical protein GGR57DRAFT_119684 [Xylariaceae sp. FL1272]|nr:hypothetical protein GGR57DRAFT_119684 [Xylariaceae sp. FL1272]
MASKGLLGDAIKTLAKKARRSIAARNQRNATAAALAEDVTARNCRELIKETKTTSAPQAENELNPRQEEGIVDVAETEHIQHSPHDATKVDMTASRHLSHDEECSFPRSVSSGSTIVVDESSRPEGQRAETDSQWVDVDSPQAENPLSPSVESTLEITESQILNVATSSFPPVPPSATLPPLPKPVIIPRRDPGGTIPFARAWASELGASSITKEDFIAFLDNLNVIMSPHIGFHMLEIAALFVSVVPYDAAEAIGGAVGALAMLGAAAVNWKRTKDYLALMNESYFHPRKLHIKIVDTKKLKKLLKLEKKDPCLLPLSEESLHLTSQERCLKYLSAHTCELDFDVPPPSKATKILARITAWEIRHKVLQADKKARWGRNRAWKRHQKGKKVNERWVGWGERQRVSGLDWLFVMNLDEWEEGKRVKEEKKREKREGKRSATWKTVGSA